MHYDLFEKIKRGSIMLWKVSNENELPKRKEMIRLLGTENFTYYKADGHHREYIRILAKLCLYLSPNALSEPAGYWAQVNMTHILFTEKEIESNSFFSMKYLDKCLGTYYVEAVDIKELEKMVRHYEHVRSITDEVKQWSLRIQNHKDQIARDGINDQIITEFEIKDFETLMHGYGDEAIQHARSTLKAWHDQYYWKSKKPKSQAAADSLVEAVT